MTHARRCIAPLIICTALAVSGCAQEQQGGILPDSDVFKVLLTTDPDTLDPARATDTNSNHVIQQIYEGLIRVDRNNEIAPALAERWEASEDGRTFTFYLREATFHTGRPVTADDVAYSFNRCLADRESSVNETYLGDIVGAAAVLAGEASEASGIRVIDEHTLQITIDAPKPYFLAKLTYPTAFVVDRETIERLGERWAELGPVGTGPFTFVAWRHNERVLLAAFERYWEGRPGVDFVEMRVTSDYQTRFARYESGAAHVTDIQTSDLPHVQDDPELAPRLHVYLRPAIFYLAMNAEANPTFANPWVRQAFALATNRQAITETVLRGITNAANGYIPQFIPGFEPDYHGLPYDPALARTFLARAGYGPDNPFPPVDLYFAAQYADVPRVVEAAAQMLEENLDIQVRPQRLEWNTLLTRYRQSELGFYSLNWWADYLDPQNFLTVLLHSQSQNNNVQFRNWVFDWLCDEGDVEQDPTRREELYRLANRVAVEAAPWIPLYFGYYLLLVSPEVEDFPFNLMGFMPYQPVRLKSGS